MRSYGVMRRDMDVRKGFTMWLSDADLVAQTIRGETETFEMLVSRYEKDLIRFLQSRIDHTQDVQDISQDIWLTVYQHLKTLKKPDQFGSWMFAIAKNTCRSYYKRKKPSVALSESHGEVEHPDDEHLRRVNRRRIMDAVSSLSQILRRTVTLYYVAGYTTGEVSNSLNVPVGTVKRRLSDARKLLKTAIKDWYQTPGPGSGWVLDH